MDRDKFVNEGAQASPFGRPGSTLANEDPFGDLLSFSPVSSANHGSMSASRPKPPAPSMTSDGPLASEKSKAQESRQKRDTFLDQMSSFLEGIETNSAPNVVPPEPPASLTTTESYTAVAFPPSASSRTSTSVFPKSSLMKEGDLFGDPFVGKQDAAPTTKTSIGLSGAMLGSASTTPHPRGSLFDDDVGLEEKDPLGDFPQPLVTSGSVGSPPQRVTPSPLPFSAPPHDVRGSVSQGQSKNKTKPTKTRGLDLEEVRRRTSLLSRTDPRPGPAPSHPAAAAAPPRDASPHFDARWGHQRRQQHAPASSDEGLHPLHAAAAPVDSGGNYFNEEILRVREQEVRASGRREEQGPWRGDALMDSAGSFLSTARDGAKTLFQDAKAGVDAVGASWQGAREEPGQERFNSNRPGRGGSRPRETDNEREFDVTFGEGRLGFTLFREDAGPRKGKGVVCKVHTGSTAHDLGVAIGDTVTCVNKTRYDTYDEVMKILPKLPRPVLITFARSAGEGSMAAAAARQASIPPEGGGANPLNWLAKLNPFEKRRGEEEDELRGGPRNLAGSMVSTSQEYGIPGEVIARGLRGGVFSWSYYGTSDGIESNTKDSYTEHVMRIQWGKTADTMISWMVARRYREFDALDMDLRDAYPDRRESLPRLPPKEFFKLAADVVERRTKGLEMYMSTLIRRFPDMLESSHLDRFLTISERLQATAPGGTTPALSYVNLGANGSSSNVFTLASEEPPADERPSLLGTGFLLNLMSSAEAWRLSTSRNSSPVDVVFCEDLVDELSTHLSRIPPEANVMQDETLHQLVARCQKAWPGLKAAASNITIAEDSCGTVLPRILQCDERMERAFESLRALLRSHGYMAR